jgi:hypothetical protein
MTRASWINAGYLSFSSERRPEQARSYAFFGFKYLVSPWNQITSAGLPLI